MTSAQSGAAFYVQMQSGAHTMDQIRRMWIHGVIDPLVAVSASLVALRLMNVAVNQPIGIGLKALRISSILIFMGAILIGPNVCAQVGALDTGFAVDANGTVNCALTQADGKILVFGNFTTINGQPKVRLARLTSAGTVDSTFYSNELGVDGLVRCALLQPDGKIVIGGDFLNVYGVPRQRIARLNADGTLDESFATQLGANAAVNSIAYDRFRNALTVGGAFTEFQGLQRGSIALLDINGSIDANTYSGSGFDGPVFNVLIDNSSRSGTFVGGLFTSFNGISTRNLAKFNFFSSTLNTSFNSFPTSGPNGAVRAIATGSSGQLMVGGDFSAYDDVPRGHLALISSSTGAANADFAISCDAPVHAIIAQSPVTIGSTTTEKYYVGGDFQSIGTEVRLGYARLVSVSSYSQQAWSIDTNFDDGASGKVLCIALQTDGKPLLTGEFGTIGGGASPYLARLYGDGGISPPAKPKLDMVGSGTDTQLIVIWNRVSYVSGYKIERSENGLSDWLLVGTSDTGSPYFPFVDGNLTPAQTYFYRVRAFSTNGDGEPSLIKSGTTLPAPWSLAGSPDTAFIQALGQGPNSWVYALCPLPNGQTLVGGIFSSIGDFQRRNIARINADGSVDPNFDSSSGPNGAVYAITVQPDGKILIGGSFTSVAGVTRNRIARLNSDGSLDFTFDPLGGANSQVEAIALYPNNMIAIVGRFSTFNNEPRAGIVRLDPTGSVDPSFSATLTFANGWTVAVQPDGKMLVGGFFQTANGVKRGHIARFEEDGALDQAFASGTGFDGWVENLKLLSDGRILVGGAFNNYDGISRSGVARLNHDGTLDLSFAPGAAVENAWVFTVDHQSDGKVLVGGWFTIVSGAPRLRVARLNSNGSLDDSFQPGIGADRDVRTLAVQADGKVLLGGFFQSINGNPSRHLTRLLGDAGIAVPATPSGLTASPASSMTIDLSWSGTPNVMGYRIWYRANAFSNWIEVATTSPTSTNWTITGLQPATSMEYALESFNSNGSSVLSQFAQTTTWTKLEQWKADNGIPLATSNLAGIGPDARPLLIKYAFGIDPERSEPQKMPKVRLFVGDNDITYLAIEVTQSISADDVVISYETSPDLVTWDGSSGATRTVSSVDNQDQQTRSLLIRDTVPIEPSKRRFIRAKVLLP